MNWYVADTTFSDEYIVYEVPSDGDCMFSSIALGLGSPQTAQSVRQDIVKFLETHRDEVDSIPLQEYSEGRLLEASTSDSAAVANYSQANDEYLKQMGKRGAWGDGVMLASACRFYNRQINVILASSGRKFVVPFTSRTDGDGYDSAIYLGYINSINHYVYLKPKDTASRCDKRHQSMATTTARSDNLDAAEHCASADNMVVDSIKPSDSQEQKASGFAIINENYDIGLFPNRQAQALSDDIKSQLLAGCSRRPKEFEFPQTNGRRYNPSWEHLFNWLRYSESLDSAYCAPCFIFAVGNKNAELIDKPFNDWKNAVGAKRGRLNAHSNSEIHNQSLIAADNFMRVAKDEMKPITSFISQAYADRVARNRSIMKSLIEIVFMCAQRGFPLRGHQWNKTEHTEDGNFAYIVKWAAKKDTMLQSHLESAAQNAKYLSPTTQNELIACIESEIREQIVRQCNKSSFVSVMADETTDCGGIEQLSLCIRYVNEIAKGKFEVCEDFLGFTKLKVANAVTITEKMLGKMAKWGIDLKKLRGKGFDGASTMSGHISGVQARIAEKFPRAKYFTHCSSHCLNLVVVQCCKVQIIRNFIDSLQRLSFFHSGKC